MITIIDYGMGNIGSIQNMIKKLGETAITTADPKLVSQATKLILPGVGSFDEGMKQLDTLQLTKAIQEAVTKKKTPLLAICLGMQLLTNSSEEGTRKGLGLINAETKKFTLDKAYKVPHMGWNYVVIQQKTKLTKELLPESRFYFVHSYHVVCKEKKHILMTTTYDTEFTSAIVHNNLYGVQFHPEKSHKFGMKLMENFIKHV
jgi:glutamine amidotransferase